MGGAPERDNGNQIVVASEHLGLVLGKLNLPLDRPRPANARLGLTLVDLPGDVELTNTANALIAELPEGHETRSMKFTEPLDKLLKSVRDVFEVRYSGWAPTIGKNRLLHGIEALPYASVGGFDLPRPIERVDIPDRLLAPRPDAPEGARRVRVGVIDTRVAPHPRLEGRYVVDRDGLDLPVADRLREGWQGHAAFVANLVLDGAPSAVLDMRTFQENPPVKGGARTPGGLRLWRFAERLAEFEDSGVQVVNCSVACHTADGKSPLVLERAIARLTPDIIVVAAAGNHGPSELTPAQREERGMPKDYGAPLFPAALDGVLSVGAGQPGKPPATFNPRDARGKLAPWIDVCAPGVDVRSAYLGWVEGGERVELPGLPPGEQAPLFYGFATWTGTSFSAANLTGIIASRIAEQKPREDVLSGVRGEFAPRVEDDLPDRAPVG
jgi:membrane-anchored mycosin MYCP